MQLPKELTTVTTFSKYLALSLFVILPILAFFWGANYNQVNNSKLLQKEKNPESAKKSLPILEVENNPYLTEKWQIYENTAVGFTFKYPEAFEKMVKPTGPIAENELLSSADTAATGITDGFSFSFAPFKGTLDQFMEIRKKVQRGAASSYPDEPVSDLGEIKFNGITGRWYALGLDNYLHPDTEVAFVHKGYAFILRTDSNSGGAEKNINTYEIEQLLSTFKFLN